MWTSGSLRHRISSIRIGRSGSARVAAKQPQRSACACFRLRKRFCPVICRSRKTAGFSTCPQTDGAMPACRSFCSRRAYRATSRSIAPGTPSPPPSRCHRGGNRDDLQVARAQKHTHHTDLCDTHPCKAGKRYGVIVRTARKAICAMNRHPCISDCTKSKKILKQGFYRENTRYKS